MKESGSFLVTLNSLLYYMVHINKDIVHVFGLFEPKHSNSGIKPEKSNGRIHLYFTNELQEGLTCPTAFPPYKSLSSSLPHSKAFGNKFGNKFGRK